MQFTDSHIHLQDHKTNNAQQIILQLKELSFSRVICVAANLNDFPAIASLYKQSPDLIIPSFGIHPWNVNDFSTSTYEIMRQFLIQYPQSLVGECGLDRRKGPDIEIQFSAFKSQLNLATELNRPLNIHLVHADDIFARLLPQITTKFLLHSFNGSTPFLESVLKRGGYISINPSILSRSHHEELIRNIPLDKLLIESDSPYQSDFNSLPSFFTKIADIRSISVQHLSTNILQNMQNFTSIKN